jgi:hypothetical protein
MAHLHRKGWGSSILFKSTIWAVSRVLGGKIRIDAMSSVLASASFPAAAIVFLVDSRPVDKYVDEA